MTIKQKIWGIPIMTILIFSIGMAAVYKISSSTYGMLYRTESVHYPFLHNIQSLEGELRTIQVGFLDVLDTQGESGIVRVRKEAEAFRDSVRAIAVIDGKAEISQKILVQFNDYFASADSAASIIIGFRKGNRAAEVERMTVALNKLAGTLQQEHFAATELFENSLGDSRNNVQMMLWTGLAGIFIFLVTLVLVSYRLIASILTNLEYLRAGAGKIAQGNFTSRIPERGKDELTQVIIGFNHMGEELQKAAEKHVQYEKQLETLNRELEGRVLARTAELAAALEEANKANAAVAYMADHDNLTGLLSRRRFQEEFERMGKYALRYQRPMSLMFVDLDKFKAINDTYGHLDGDKFLQSVAGLLKKTLRTTDYVGRWGGTNLQRSCQKPLRQLLVRLPPRLSGYSARQASILPARVCLPRRASVLRHCRNTLRISSN